MKLLNAEDGTKAYMCSSTGLDLSKGHKSARITLEVSNHRSHEISARVQHE